jgi:hypothetical protein
MKMTCTLKGTYSGYFTSEGVKVLVQFNKVLYVPSLNVNLLSISKCLEQPGIFFSGDAEGISLIFGKKKYTFDKERIHGNGKLYAADIVFNGTP